MVRSAGLEAIESGHFFFTLIPPRMLQVVKERLIGAGDAEGAHWDGSAWIARVLAGILEKEPAAIPRAPSALPTLGFVQAEEGAS